MTRIAGAAVATAGLAFIGLGTAGIATVTNVVGHATVGSCATDPNTGPSAVPTGDACVNESFEGSTAATAGVANDCGSFGLTANDTTDGWVFVLPQGDSDGDTGGEGNIFTSLTAVFDTGSQTGTVTGPPTGQKAVLSAPAGSTLLEAFAVVTDDSGTSDGANTLFFEVTGVCVATPAPSSTTTATTVKTTTTTTPTTTTTTPTTTTTTTPTTTTTTPTTTTTTPTTTTTTPTTTTTTPTTTTTTPTTATTAATTTTTTTSAASGSLNITTTTTTKAAGEVSGITTTPSTGADTQFGAGLALLTLGGGLLFGNSRFGRRKRP